MEQAKRRPRVAHLTSVHEAGDPRIAQKECATLAAAGYDVVIVAPGPECWLGNGVRHRPVFRPNNRWERIFKTVPEVFRAAWAEKADIYHFHDPELIGVGLLLRMRGARVVFDVHEDLALDVMTKPWIHPSLRPLVSAAARAIQQTPQSWFTAIVSATPNIAENFRHRRLVVVRNYPDFPEAVDKTDGLKDDARTDGETPRAIYVGGITALRGVEQMVRAMEDPRLPERARLDLVGTFEDADLLDRCAKLPGWSRVETRGYLKGRQLTDALQSAQVGMLILLPAPNFENALPTKFFEYMIAGLPVVASKSLRICREVVSDHQCGIIVDPRDVAEIGDAMARLFADPVEARAMGERGRAAVRGRYEWRSEARNLIQLYAEIA